MGSLDVIARPVEVLGFRGSRGSFIFDGCDEAAGWADVEFVIRPSARICSVEADPQGTVRAHLGASSQYADGSFSGRSQHLLRLPGPRHPGERATLASLGR